jgi:hypothetical protein
MTCSMLLSRTGSVSVKWSSRFSLWFLVGEDCSEFYNRLWFLFSLAYSFIYFLQINYASNDTRLTKRSIYPCVGQIENLTALHSVCLVSHCYGWMRNKIQMAICLFMALQLLWNLAAFHFINVHTGGRTPWPVDQAVPKPVPTHRINAHRNPCFEWDSNPRS